MIHSETLSFWTLLFVSCSMILTTTDDTQQNTTAHFHVYGQFICKKVLHPTCSLYSIKAYHNNSKPPKFTDTPDIMCCPKHAAKTNRSLHYQKYPTGNE
jgi:hypothetical protein